MRALRRAVKSSGHTTVKPVLLSTDITLNVGCFNSYLDLLFSVTEILVVKTNRRQLSIAFHILVVSAANVQTSVSAACVLVWR